MIHDAGRTIGLDRALNTIGLSRARWSLWLRRSKNCQLADESSCPKTIPQRLTSPEVRAIKELVTDPELRHFSISSLSLYAKRIGKVFASIPTWSRIIREYGLNRSGKRIYPEKPREGIRAERPHQIWHIDLSVIRLTNGTRCYIQAVMDNFSRYVLAWRVSLNYGGSHTRLLLLEAIEKAKELGLGLPLQLMMDSGVENVTAEVDSVLKDHGASRLLAQIDVQFSNSMILFRQLKNNYLYFQELTSFESLRNHVDWYLTDANERIPRQALSGATPLEVILGRWSSECRSEIREACYEAQRLRILSNQSRHCLACA